MSQQEPEGYRPEVNVQHRRDVGPAVGKFVHENFWKIAGVVGLAAAAAAAFAPFATPLAH